MVVSGSWDEPVSFSWSLLVAAFVLGNNVVLTSGVTVTGVIDVSALASDVATVISIGASV